MTTEIQTHNHIVFDDIFLERPSKEAKPVFISYIQSVTVLLHSHRSAATPSFCSTYIEDFPFSENIHFMGNARAHVLHILTTLHFGFV